MLRICTILALLFAALPLRAATLPELRTGLARADARLQSVREEQKRLRGELDAVAARIEALKRGEPRADGLFGRDELDTLLKRSQELSEQLNEQVRLERHALLDREGPREQLLGSLDAELQSVTRRWMASGSQTERRALLDAMKQLRAERDRLRPGSPPVPVAPAPAGASEDPEVLLERADALLDAADKLQREDAALAARLQELEQERELSERLGDFLSEGALFDEQDRRLTVSRGRRAAMAPAADQAPAADVPDSMTEGGPTAPAGGTSAPAPFPTDTTTSPPRSSPAPEPTREGLAGAQLGVARASPVLDEDATIEQLSERRAQLKAQAAEARRRAEELTRRAREME